MNRSRIIVAGIGPGSEQDITPAVMEAVAQSDVIVGYKYYFQFITSYLRPNAECIDTGMKRERDRAAQAFEIAEQGRALGKIAWNHGCCTDQFRSRTGRSTAEIALCTDCYQRSKRQLKHPAH